jgi:glycosyltransferase involved in cell wall biosynthesis
MTNRITLTESVPNSEIHRIYHRADLFAIPTLLEGFCIPVAEAMAAGLPVVTSDIPVLREVGGEVTIRVAPSPERFRQAIQWLLNHPEESLRLAKEGLEEARRFDAPVWEAREAAVYYELLKVGAPREQAKA